MEESAAANDIQSSRFLVKLIPLRLGVAVTGKKYGVSNVVFLSDASFGIPYYSCFFNRTHSYRRLVRPESMGKCCPEPNVRISYVRNFGIRFVFLWS